MSRSGYSDDCEFLNLYRATVERAIRGKRGQAMFIALRDALDAMPEKKLITDDLIAPTGEVCALGALAQAKQIPVEDVDPEDQDRVAKLFNIAPCLAAEIVYENDERHYNDETPEARWQRMRNWVEEQIQG